MRIEIVTRYKSDRNGAGRYHARAKGFTATASIQIDHSLSSEQNHALAAEKLATKLGASKPYMEDSNGITYVWHAHNGTYEQQQIDRLAPSDTHTIRISDAGRNYTKHLNITRAQLDAIRAILGEEN